MVGLATTLPGCARVVTDQPIEDGGQAAGMSSVELFVGSLSQLCGLFRGSLCCDHHQISTKGLSVERNGRWRSGRIGWVRSHWRFTCHMHYGRQSDRPSPSGDGCTVHQSIALPAGVAIELNPHHRGEKAIVKEEPGSPVSARRPCLAMVIKGLGGTLALGQIVSRVFVRSTSARSSRTPLRSGLETECG